MASRSRDIGAEQILCAELFRWWRKYHPGKWKSNALDDNSTCCQIEEELRREKSALESANEKTSEDHAVVITKRDALMARASNLEQLLAAARGDLELANTYRDRALMANENLQRALEDLQCERDAEISLLAEQQRASEDAIVDAHAASMEATREAYAAEMRDVQYATDKSVQNALTEMDNMESTIQECRRDNMNLRKALDEAIFWL